MTEYLFTLAEAAARLRLHPRTLLRRIASGEIKPRNVARVGAKSPRWRIAEAELQRYRVTVGDSWTEYLAERRARRLGLEFSRHDGEHPRPDSRRLGSVIYEHGDATGDLIVVGRVGKRPALRMVIGRHGRTVAMDREDAKQIAAALLQATEDR